MQIGRLISDPYITYTFLATGSGGCMQVLKKAYESFSLTDLDVTSKFKALGTDRIVDYFYRDDATALYQCISKYVQRVVGVFYQSNERVRNDMELQQFIFEVHNEGFNWDNKNSRGEPIILRVFSLRISSQAANVLL